MGKWTRSRVLQGTARLCGALRGGDGVRKFSSSCEARQGWVKTKPYEVGAKTPSFGPALPHCHPYRACEAERIEKIPSQ